MSCSCDAQHDTAWRNLEPGVLLINHIHCEYVCLPFCLALHAVPIASPSHTSTATYQQLCKHLEPSIVLKLFSYTTDGHLSGRFLLLSAASAGGLVQLW